jgi:enoyl-CoA hydratase/carnithine racemase
MSGNGDEVLVERDGAVTVLTLNRPDRLNAWSDAMETRCFALLDEAEADPDVRAIVLTGAGRGFCSGSDMSAQPAPGTRPADRKPATDRRLPLTLRKPLIGAVNGPAAGLGFALAMYCDIRFCAPATKLTSSFARRGLAAEFGLSWLLPRVVGVSTALDVLVSGRVILGEEAFALGLVQRLTAPDQVLTEARAYAADLAENCSPWSMATAKRQIYEDLERDSGTAFADADRLMLASETLPDFAEGVASFMERRAPRFPPLGGEL